MKWGEVGEGGGLKIRIFKVMFTEASEGLEGYGGILPQKSLRSRVSEINAIFSILHEIFRQKINLNQV